MGEDPSRRLAEASAHDDDLHLLAYRLMDGVGLPRGRLTALTLQCRQGGPADQWKTVMSQRQ